MNKLFTKVATLSIGLAMAIGVGVAVGSNKKHSWAVSAVNNGDVFTRISAVSALSDGDEIIFVNQAETYACGTTQNTNNRTPVAITVTNHSYTYSSDDDVQVFVVKTATISGSTKYGFHTGTGYIYSASSSANNLKTNTTAATTAPSGTSAWSISSISNYVVSTSNVTNTSYYLAFNGTSYFSQYKSNQTKPYIFKKTSSARTVSSIEVKTQPKVSYTAGEYFDPTGLVITATYSSGSPSTEDITYSSTAGFTFNPNTSTQLQTSNTSVTITYGGQSTSLTITVSAAIAVTSVTLEPESKTLDVGGTASLTTTVLPANASNKNLTWESSDATVVSVSDGTITGLKVGIATITVKSVADNSKTDTCAVTVSAGNVSLNYTNSPFSNTTASSTVDNVTLDGIGYRNVYGQKYSTHNTLEFKSNNTDAYLGNTSPYTHYISKVVISWYAHNNSNCLTVYEGTSVLPSSGTGSSVAVTDNGLTSTYTFTENTNQYFNIKRTTNNNYWLEFNSIEIYYGDEARVLSGISVKTSPRTAYLSGEKFDPTGLVITLTYSSGTPATIDVAYTSENKDSFTFSVSTVTAAGNNTITYAGKTCDLALSLTTVATVDSVAEHPESIYVDEGIEGSDVTLNVTLASGDKTAVNADHVNVDDDEPAEDVVATAWYTAAETDPTKKATFTVDVVRAPVYIYPVDDIVSSDLAATSSTYTAFSGVSKTSSAVYSGQSNLPNAGMIGLRSAADSSQNHSGIVSTTSGGIIYKITITDIDHDSRYFDVYGSNTAYESAENLYGDSKGTLLGSISKASPTLNIYELELAEDYQYVGLRSHDGLIKSSKISFTWKVEGTDNPMTDVPQLSLGKDKISVGASTTLSVTTTPEDSDEILIVTSSAPEVASVSGTGKTYVVNGVSAGTATITVQGKQSGYQSSIGITVETAVQNESDKILTTTTLGLSGSSYVDNDGDHDYDGDIYTTSNVCVTNGIQFKKQADGKLYNKLAMIANIKRITLIMNSNNSGTAAVYKGDEANPNTNSIDPVKTYNAKGVNTYEVNAAFFTITTSSNSNAINVDKIIVELDDTSYSDLALARSAASTILTGLKNLCGEGGSGVVTQSQWDALSSQLIALNLTSEAKNILKDATRLCLDDLSQGGALIENAMAHYDACVTKFGFTPVGGVTSATPSGRISISTITQDNSSTTLIIILVSLVGAAAIGGYFLFKKKKQN